MHRHGFLIFSYFGVLFITLPNYPKNSLIVLKFSETLNLNNSYTISKKEENNFIFRPMTHLQRANFN